MSNSGDPIFLAMCRQFKLPVPVCELCFAPPRKWRFDYAFFGGVSGGVALEVNGAVWTRGRHTRGQGYINDMEKMNRAMMLNWRVLQVTPDKLRTVATIEYIRELLRR